MSKSSPKRKRQSLQPLRIRARLAVECGPHMALNDAGADLLEQIVISGSLSEAARQLHYSYRYAWLLVDAMNKSWPSPLVTTATGGKRGGGTRLTELGASVLAAYRHMQLEFEHFLDIQSAQFKANLPP